MNHSRINPFLIGFLNMLLGFAGTCGTIYVLSLIDKVSFFTKVKDPVMMTILIACPIIAGAYAYFRARKNRLASNA